jgi:hypothetical protein
VAQIDISANNKSKTSLTTAEKEWKDEAFGLTGYATAAKMKFPRPPDRSPDQGNMVLMVGAMLVMMLVVLTPPLNFRLLLRRQRLHQLLMGVWSLG